MKTDLSVGVDLKILQKAKELINQEILDVEKVTA
jgi:hypothetical protein